MSGAGIVIVGASLAGLRTAQSLREEGYEGALTLIGAEAQLPYDRPPLSKELLAGAASVEEVDLPLDRLDIESELHLGSRAVALDLGAKEVRLDDGDVVAYEGLVIATGAHPRTLPGLQDRSLPDVFVLRTLEDCLALRARLDDEPTVVVVGAGFIGSEVAATCHGRGLGVTVIEALPVPMERAVGVHVGHRCARLHADHGVTVRLGTGVTGVVSDDAGRTTGVALANGTVAPADVVVLGVGVSPTTGWLDGSGLDVANGVVCDSRCRAQAQGATVPGVVAAGDVARWYNPLFGEHMRVEHWTNASEQGRSAALTLLHGDDAPEFAPIPYVWSDQYETKIQMVGRPGPEFAVVDGTLDGERFALAYGSEGRVVGALAFNRPGPLMKVRALIAERAAFPPA